MFIHFDVGIVVEYMPWGRKDEDGRVIDQAWFCAQVAGTNKLELLKWLREVKHCEWDEKTITVAALIGNLEMLKYCFSNNCPCDEKSRVNKLLKEDTSTVFDFFSTKWNLRERRKKKRHNRRQSIGHINILKYLVEERKISMR